jgi:hypothetical protein
MQSAQRLPSRKRNDVIRRPDAHTTRQRSDEATRAERAELEQGATVLQELNGSTRRDIAEVWLEETRRRA